MPPRRQRKRMARRRPAVRRQVRRARQNVHYFKRTVYNTAYLTASSAAAVAAARNFRLVDLPAYTEFTALYDQYQIRSVKISLIPRADSANVVNGSALQSIGNVWSCLDYDDGTSPANIDTLLQYPSLKRTQMTRIHTRSLKPKFVSQVYSSAGVVGYAIAPKNQWLDVGSSSVEHYGVKFWLDQIPSSSTSLQYDAQITFNLAFKNVR